MLETYNLQSSAYYSHLTEANYDLAAAAAAAAASNSLAASNQAAALQQASQAAVRDQMNQPGVGVVGHMNGMLDHTGQATSVIPKLEFDKGIIKGSRCFNFFGAQMEFVPIFLKKTNAEKEGEIVLIYSNYFCPVRLHQLTNRSKRPN